MILPACKFNILVVDDEVSIRDSLAGWLEKDGYQVDTAASGREALEKMAAKYYDIALIDVKMPEMDGLTLLKKIKELGQETAVIIMTAYGAIEDAVNAMKLGAYDYLLKPFDLEEISLIIGKLVEMQSLTRENLILRERVAKISRFENLVGQSEAMQRLYEIIQDVAATDATVLITGETGTGKELVARAIHAQSPRRYGPFIAVNCGAFPENLLESELFGHEKGAFTDAKFTKRGRLELAHGGTLFLDEIGDISMKMQIDLLRVLETHEFTRVGGTIPIRSDFRVIAATHQDLEKAIAARTFRRDLYYRLNVVHIEVPPLRERREDIPLLAEYFLRRYVTETNKKIGGLHPEALAALQEYDWPGNVRELENVIERAVVICKGSQIRRQDLPFAAKEELPPPTGRTLEEVEREHIYRVLKETEGNISRAAKVLAINRTTLYHKMKKYGLLENRGLPSHSS